MATDKHFQPPVVCNAGGDDLGLPVVPNADLQSSGQTYRREARMTLST